MIKIKGNSITVYMTEDGGWFHFAGETNMRPVVLPDEKVYAYSHGGRQYREACESIARYKATMGWGGA